MDLILIFGAFLVLLAIRVPIAFSMLATAMLYLLINDVSLGLLVQRVAGGVDSFPLLAVPLFLAAGFLMNTMGITDRIFEFAGTLVRHLPGGLGHVNVVSSVIFSGMSGSVVADAGGLGVVEIRAMRKAGYSNRFSAAITAASSLIGPIIPPSVVMVVYAFVTEVSLGRMFLAGIVPGALMALAMMVLIVIMATTGLEDCPRQPRATRAELCRAFRRAFLPMMAPVILVAGILSGIFTPTEAGVVAVIYVLIIGSFTLDMNLRHILRAFSEAASTTAATLFIIASSLIFTWIVATADLPQIVAAWFDSLGASPEIALLIMVGITLVLGMFLEGIPIMMVFGPIFMAVAQAQGIDLIHLGIVFIVSMMIGGISPPVGIALYVVMSIAKLPLSDFMKGIWPFYLAIIAVIVLLIYVPQLSLWLPDLLWR